jgi:hypothetical protein
MQQLGAHIPDGGEQFDSAVRQHGGAGFQLLRCVERDAAIGIESGRRVRDGGKVQIEAVAQFSIHREAPSRESPDPCGWQPSHFGSFAAMHSRSRRSFVAQW